MVFLVIAIALFAFGILMMISSDEDTSFFAGFLAVILGAVTLGGVQNFVSLNYNPVETKTYDLIEVNGSYVSLTDKSFVYDDNGPEVESLDVDGPKITIVESDRNEYVVVEQPTTFWHLGGVDKRTLYVSKSGVDF